MGMENFTSKNAVENNTEKDEFKNVPKFINLESFIGLDEYDSCRFGSADNESELEIAKSIAHQKGFLFHSEWRGSGTYDEDGKEDGGFDCYAAGNKFVQNYYQSGGVWGYE